MWELTELIQASCYSQFGWDWGDGTPNENGWFPMEHTYSNVTQNYIVKVTSNYSGELRTKPKRLFASLHHPFLPITLSDIIPVYIPDNNLYIPH